MRVKAQITVCKKCKKKFNKEEYNKVMKDVKENGFGIYDTEKDLRINPERLAYFWKAESGQHNLDRTGKIKEEVKLHTDLLRIEKIYKEKFGDDSAMEIELFKKDPALFIERLIRAVEICSMKYALNRGGALNVRKRMNIVKGKHSFLWEVW